MTIADKPAIRRRRKGEDAGESGAQATRRKLLAAATRLFSEFGYNAVSVRAIAQEAGVNAALVNYHYGTKEALFEEVIRINTADHVADIPVSISASSHSPTHPAPARFSRGTRRRSLTAASFRT